ncbi:MAG: transcriptional regulator [Candidatus Parabeggiatoa sp. nov. 2]|nr:MAG: transcriptional regulator [Beggiatoa sp. 4572_84]RKZ64534.1 MAG: transcriptional regulator [Gammaproteobacteria bacterium]HEC85557.1 transcriptional regulator [Thioploca sp.]
MAKNFIELHNARTSEAKARVQARVQRALAEMPLQELQTARRLSQQQLANLLDIEPATIHQLERSTDMYISTLRSHIEAMGGQLDITAHFPDGNVSINQFTQINDKLSNSDLVMSMAS